MGQNGDITDDLGIDDDTEDEECGARKARGVNFDMSANTKTDAPAKERLDPKRLLQLNYDDTTLNEESTDEEATAEARPTEQSHSRLLREESHMKWNQHEVEQQETAMAEEIAKLKQQEMAAIDNSITYYRQQSEDL